MDRILSEKRGGLYGVFCYHACARTGATLTAAAELKACRRSVGKSSGGGTGCSGNKRTRDAGCVDQDVMKNSAKRPACSVRSRGCSGPPLSRESSTAAPGQTPRAPLTACGTAQIAGRQPAPARRQKAPDDENFSIRVREGHEPVFDETLQRVGLRLHAFLAAMRTEHAAIDRAHVTPGK